MCDVRASSVARNSIPSIASSFAKSVSARAAFETPLTIVRATVRAEFRETLQAFQTFAATSSTESSSMAPRWTACAIRLSRGVFWGARRNERRASRRRFLGKREHCGGGRRRRLDAFPAVPRLSLRFSDSSGGSASPVVRRFGRSRF